MNFRSNVDHFLARNHRNHNNFDQFSNLLFYIVFVYQFLIGSRDKHKDAFCNLGKGEQIKKQEALLNQTARGGRKKLQNR